MLIAVHFPFSDERLLFPTRSELVRGGFGRIGERHRFHRNLGQIIMRPRGGFPGWIGESDIGTVRRGIRIGSGDAAFGSPKWGRVAFKRYYFDGLHAGYFSIGLSVRRDLERLAIDDGSLIKKLVDIGRIPISSPHRSARDRRLADYGDLAVDLYASGSVSKLKDLSQLRYMANVHVGDPIVIASAVAAPGALANLFDKRHLALGLKSPFRSASYGHTAIGGFLRWANSNPFALLLACSDQREAVESRFLRGGIARLYVESYAIERMIALIQSASVENCDEEGRKIIGESVNRALRRLEGVDRPEIAVDRESYESLVLIFSRIFRPGRIGDLEAILTRLKARPNLKRIFVKSVIVDEDSAIEARTKVEIVMGNKTVQQGGVNISESTVNTGGDIVGRDKKVEINVREHVDAALKPVAQIIEGLPAADKEKANQQLSQIKEEASKGKDANDSALAKLVDGLVGLVPGAVAAVVSAFATPILGGVVGPVTKFVLDKIQGK